MSVEMMGAIAVVSFVGLVAMVIIYRRIPKKLNKDYFAAHWRELKTYLRSKKTWPEAIIEADRLLDKALKKRKFRGKSMGERLVSAQRIFTDNDSLWFAHNLCKKVLVDDNVRLKEADVKDALLGFGQALRDIGALPNGGSRKS